VNVTSTTSSSCSSEETVRPSRTVAPEERTASRSEGHRLLVDTTARVCLGGAVLDVVVGRVCVQPRELLGEETDDETLATRIAGLTSRARIAFWHDLAGERSKKRSARKIPVKELVEQVDELIAQIEGQATVVATVELPLEAVRGLPAVTGATYLGERLEVHTTDAAAASMAIQTLATQMGRSIRDLTIRQPNLEDVFITMTGRTIRPESAG